MSSEVLSAPLKDTLALFTAGGKPWTTPEVAEQLAIGRRTAYARLERLAERALLETKKVGASARVWWRPQSVGVVGDIAETGGQSAEGRTQVGTQEEFERLVEAVDEYALFTLDTDGCIQTWNPGVRRIKGYEADEILGEHFSTFYTDDAQEAGVPMENLSKAATQGVVEDEGWRVRKDGSQFWANVTIMPIHDDDGNLEGYAKVTRDMSDRHEYEQQLREQRDYIQQVLEAAPVGVVIVEPDGTFETVNEQAAELLELEQDGSEIKTVGVNAVYDEDDNRIPVEERPYIQIFETGESIRDWHAQIERSDGSRRWLSTNVEPITDNDGEVTRALVTIQDISQLKAQAERLERQRDELRSELDEMFERITDGFYALDEGLRFTYINDRAAETLEVDKSAIGQHLFDEMAATEQFKEALDEARDSQEPVVFEDYDPRDDRWFSHALYPSESGLSVYFRDITERKEREQELKRFEVLAGKSRDVNVILDADGTYRYVSPSMANELGHEPDALVGENAFDYVHPEDRERVFEEFEAMVDDPTREPTLEYQFERGDGSWAVIESRGRNLLDDPDIEGIVVYSRDVTERTERERELTRFKRAVEAAGHSIYMTDSDGTITYVNPAFEETTGYPREEVIGETPGLLDSGEHSDEYFEQLWERITAGDRWEEEITNQRKNGELYTAHQTIAPVTESDGSIDRFVAIQTDVTERKEREQELEQYKRIVETIDDGIYVLDDDHRFTMLNNGFLSLTGYDRHELVGAPVETVFGEEFIEIANEKQASLESGERDVAVLEEELYRADGSSVIVEIRFDLFAGNEGETGRVGVVRDVSERVEREQELEALNNLNDIVHEITDVVITQSTRTEIEQTVCEGLAAADAYEFAWLATVDPTTNTFDPRTTAGTRGYAEEITISLDPDEPGSEGPAARAIRSQETQVVQDVFSDPTFEPWRDAAREYGFCSLAAIPIVHEGTVYGVLGVYADRPNAFDTSERDVIGQLGEVVGHAIAAAERKRALLSDEVVELEFQITDVFSMLGLPKGTADRITLDHAVPRGDDEYLVYGTMTTDGIEVVRELTDVLPHWESVRIRSTDEQVNFDVRLTEPPVLSEVAALGGYFERFVIEDGDCQMVIHLAPSVDVRRVMETVEEAYPEATMLRRTQIPRPINDAGHIPEPLIAELTERQQAALDAAYHAGYFEWPRETDGSQVAESLGISPSTFSHHLRKAQQKVFETLYASPTLATR